VPCGMNGHTVVKDGQIVLNAESSVLDRVGNDQKKFSQSVHTQEVTGSSPVVSTKKTPRAARLWEFFFCPEPKLSSTTKYNKANPPHFRQAICSLHAKAPENPHFQDSLVLPVFAAKNHY